MPLTGLGLTAKLFLITITLLIVFLTGGVGGYLLGNQKTANPTSSTNSVEVNDETAFTADFSKLGTFPSLDRRHTLAVLPVEDLLDSNSIADHFCQFTLSSINLEGVLGRQKIHCYIGDYGTTAFPIKSQWVEGNTLVLEDPLGEINIVKNSVSEGVDKVNYDSESLTFILTEDNLNYWLYRKNQTENQEFVILNRKNEVLRSLSFAFPPEVLYDHVNNGFIFIAKEKGSTDAAATFSINFLSSDNLAYRTLLKSRPKELPGRGCNSAELESTKGTVVITEGCFTIGEEYYTAGKLHLNLN